MPRLSPDERGRAIGHLEAGVSVSRVARQFGVTRRTIHSLQRRFQTTQTTRDRPRTGRPRITTPVVDRFIRTQHLRNRFQSATHTAMNIPGHQPISRQTVSRRLAAHGIRARRPLQRPQLTRRHRQARLAWAHVHSTWRRHDWATVLFTDESRFVLGRHDGRMRCYRRTNERFLDACIHEAPNRGYGQVMVWGGITTDHRTPLVNLPVALTGAAYVANILQPHVLPFVQQHNPTTLQQDNAPPHRARVTQQFLTDHNIDLINPWPAVSPDLNPIEHVWDMLGRTVSNMHPPPQNNDELFDALSNAWNNIPQQQLATLVHSMRRRCQAVVNAAGGHTRY